MNILKEKIKYSDRLAFYGAVYVYVAIINIFALTIGTMWMSGETYLELFIDGWLLTVVNLNFWLTTVIVWIIGYLFLSFLNKKNLRKVTWGIIIIITLPHILVLTQLFII